MPAAYLKDETTHGAYVLGKPVCEGSFGTRKDKTSAMIVENRTPQNQFVRTTCLMVFQPLHRILEVPILMSRVCSPLV